MVVGMIIIGISLFCVSGDLAWRGAWGYVALVGMSSVLILYGPLRLDPGLIEERLTRKADAKRWDKIFVLLTGVLGIAELVVPALNHRWNWPPVLPAWTSIAGFVVTGLGTVLLISVMHVNRFFSTVIRIQNDRGHQVIDSGLYGVVRHPGYATWSIRTLGVPLLLGSLWAFIPAVVFVLMFALRAVLEERVLRSELPGYAEYERKVRWRLVPGVW